MLKPWSLLICLFAHAAEKYFYLFLLVPVFIFFIKCNFHSLENRNFPLVIVKWNVLRLTSEKQDEKEADTSLRITLENEAKASSRAYWALEIQV